MVKPEGSAEVFNSTHCNRWFLVASRESRDHMHLRALSRMPRPAQNISPDVKLTFVVDVLTVSLPLFENKDPQNPEPDTGGDGGGA